VKSRKNKESKGNRESGEKRRGTRQTRGILVGILLMGSVLSVMLWMMLCGGCRTFGGGGLPPRTLSGQSAELRDINGKLYDYLQILLWVGRNNYDNHDNYDCGGDKGGNHKPEMRSYRFGNGMPGNRRLRNYDESESCKPGMENRKLGKLNMDGLRRYVAEHPDTYLKERRKNLG
jgi:hypothetical protein